MEFEDLLEVIWKRIQKNKKELQAYKDLYAICTQVYLVDKKLAVRYLKLESEMLEKMIPISKDYLTPQLFEVHRKVLKFGAKADFEMYLKYVEIARKPEEKFYMPRRRVLKQAVDALQRVADGETKELFLSMPPRVGKTSLLMFYCTWQIGRNSEVSNLYSAYSDVITNAFYNGCLEIMKDPVTYKWEEIFSDTKISRTNSKDETIDVGREKRYPSLTCRSLYGTLNGACDCSGIEIADDLIGGIEEALNKDRLNAAWSKVDNNLIPRAKETASIVWVGTRWSLVDPIGRRLELVLHDEKFKNRKIEIITIPALDENEQSNFEYQYGVGFSTDYYMQRRASFERNDDMASWLAQYMGQPIERSGALFEPQEMRYFNGDLPDESQLVRKFMAVDPAFGGGDYTASPIVYEYEDGSMYVVDVVYNNGDKTVTQPEIVRKIMKHEVNAARFEATKATEEYKLRIEEMLKERGYRLNITTMPAPNNVAKEQRIFDKAPEIREMYFLEESKRDKEYNLFMQNVYSFTMTGKNKHDDAPDSLAQVIAMSLQKKAVEIFRRPF